MANYIWKSTSVLYLTVAPSFWKWESKAYIRDRSELEKFCPLPWLKFIAVAPLSLWTPSPLWAPLTPWGPFASVWPFKPCSERPTQLNSTQPVLKMFRTQQTERFQLFWVVRVFRAPDALWTLLQLNSTQLNLTQMPVELSWVELSRVGLSEQGFTGSPVGGGFRVLCAGSGFVYTKEVDIVFCQQFLNWCAWRHGCETNGISHSLYTVPRNKCAIGL